MLDPKFIKPVVFKDVHLLSVRIADEPTETLPAGSTYHRASLIDALLDLQQNPIKNGIGLYGITIPGRTSSWKGLDNENISHRVANIRYEADGPLMNIFGDVHPTGPLYFIVTDHRQHLKNAFWLRTSTATNQPIHKAGGNFLFPEAILGFDFKPLVTLDTDADWCSYASVEIPVLDESKRITSTVS